MNPFGEGMRHRFGSAVILSVLALGIMFWGLFQIDLPFARFLRSLHLPWLEQAGDVGTRLGSGAMLVSLSVALLFAGFALKRPQIFEAGWRSLLAHGLAALAAQALKHTIGRPRPRFMHADNGFPWRPSFESGWDSFPSGHTTASFAVATVLAKIFPRLALPAYGLASFVAVSRAVRGSHFPTDVMAGVCLGMAVGISVVHPIRDWKQWILDGTTYLLPYLLLVFSLLWLITHSPSHPTSEVMMAAGVACVGLGIIVRIYGQVSCASLLTSWTGWNLGTMLIVIGVALTTGLWVIVILAGLLCLIHSLVVPHAVTKVVLPNERPHVISMSRVILAEIPLMAALALAILFIPQFKGLLPIF
jgi:membrane-associated phospholipid phosphatase